MSRGAAQPTADMFAILGQDASPGDPRTPEGTTPTGFHEFAETVLVPAVARAR